MSIYKKRNHNVCTVTPTVAPRKKKGFIEGNVSLGSFLQNIKSRKARREHTIL
uniref:Uncharacterized protein n=1 Tax=Rhizophora mucronata TaxID=61149 RepID=A0A2P2NZ61_RHIMU